MVAGPCQQGAPTTPQINTSVATNVCVLSSRGQNGVTSKDLQAPRAVGASGWKPAVPMIHWSQTGWGGGAGACHFECAGEEGGPLTICRTSAETICMQHMAVASAHTMVDRTLRAHTLKSSSCGKRCGRTSASSRQRRRQAPRHCRQGLG